MSLFLCPFFDRAIQLIQKAITQRADWNTQPSTSEKVFVAWQILKLVSCIAVVGLLGIGLSYILVLTTESIRFSGSFFLQIAIYIAYFSLIRNGLGRIVKRVGDWIQPRTSPYLPRYTLGNESITLDLAITDIRDGDRKFLVDIPFKEVDALEVMTYLEADQYVQHQTGLSIMKKLRAVRDTIPEQIAYLKGTIPKPKKYATVLGRTLPILIMIGPDLYYIISVANENNDELLQAFQAYKKRKSSEPSTVNA